MDISSKYQKLDQVEHVLTRPGMYIGSICEDTVETWIYDDNSKTMIKKSIKYIGGLFKIFDEVLVNTFDHSIRLKQQKQIDEETNLMKNIKVEISKETGIIEVYNDGNGIDIIVHPEHKIYIPELIFGNLLTSTSFDNNVERTTGSVNGIGSKCTNIFSDFFEIETIDSVRKLHYKQRFENNMSIKLPPTITKYTKKPFTIIRFKPDYKRFGTIKLSDDMFEIMRRRVYDATAVTDSDISVFFNNDKLPFKSFEKYADCFIGSKSDHVRAYENISDRWEIVASYNDYNGFDQISFVNGILTIQGGKHVDCIVTQITKKLTELIVKKKKGAVIKPNMIKENLIVFVKSTIINPAFNSQTKETLTTPISKFGSKPEVSDKFIEKLYKSGIVEKILQISEISENKTLKKTDGKKKVNIRGIVKLEDANWSGTPKSKQCTLILTEGNSAATMAIAGLSVVGKDKFGVYPLRGKILNVRGIFSWKQIFFINFSWIINYFK